MGSEEMGREEGRRGKRASRQKGGSEGWREREKRRVGRRGRERRGGEIFEVFGGVGDEDPVRRRRRIAVARNIERCLFFFSPEFGGFHEVGFDGGAAVGVRRGGREVEIRLSAAVPCRGCVCLREAREALLGPGIDSMRRARWRRWHIHCLRGGAGTYIVSERCATCQSRLWPGPVALFGRPTSQPGPYTCQAPA